MSSWCNYLYSNIDIQVQLDPNVTAINPVSIKKAKIAYNFDLSEFNRINGSEPWQHEHLPPLSLH